jgi:hypothetical protein
VAALERENKALMFKCDAAEARGEALQAHAAQVSQMHTEEVTRLKGMHSLLAVWPVCTRLGGNA